MNKRKPAKLSDYMYICGSKLLKTEKELVSELVARKEIRMSYETICVMCKDIEDRSGWSWVPKEEAPGVLQELFGDLKRSDSSPFRPLINGSIWSFRCEEGEFMSINDKLYSWRGGYKKLAELGAFEIKRHQSVWEEREDCACFLKEERWEAIDAFRDLSWVYVDDFMDRADPAEVKAFAEKAGVIPE